MPRDEVRSVSTVFCQEYIKYCGAHPDIPVHCAFPGYLLELVDPLILAQMREMHGRGTLDWLTCGYTEPILPFWTPWLTSENMRMGQTIFSERAGTTPSGFVPPYSAWNPSAMATLRKEGIDYAVVSRHLLPPEFRPHTTYWTTESGGTTMRIVPADIWTLRTIPEDVPAWIEQRAAEDPRTDPEIRSITAVVTVPLDTFTKKAFQKFRQIIKQLDNSKCTCETVRLDTVFSDMLPCGSCRLPEALFETREATTPPTDLTALLCRDHFSTLHRTLLRVASACSLCDDPKLLREITPQVLAAGDINRFLDGDGHGISIATDRRFSYGTLCKVDTAIFEKEQTKHGVIEILDQQWMGIKSIAMTNKSMRASIDFKNGGVLYGLDFRPRSLNICSALSETRHPFPEVVSPKISRVAFADHLVASTTSFAEFSTGTMTQISDCSTLGFEHTLKKSATGVRTVLRRPGSVLIDGKNYPMLFEKVFGLEHDEADLSVNYQFVNHTLTPYIFKLVIECHLCLPGAAHGAAYIATQRRVRSWLGVPPLELPDIAQWEIFDLMAGVRMQWLFQKPLDVWCYSYETPEHSYLGTAIVLSVPVTLEPGNAWALIGKLSLRTIRSRLKEPFEHAC